MATNIFINLSVVLFVSIIFMLLRHLFPNKNIPQQSILDSTKITDYKRYNRLNTFVIIITSIITSYAWYTLLYNLSTLQNKLDENIFTSPINEGTVLALAVPLGLTSAFLITSLLFRILLKEKYHTHSQVLNHQAKFNMVRANNAIVVIGFFIVATIAFFVTNSYVRLTTDEIILNRFFSIYESTYEYETEISSIQQVISTEETNDKQIKDTYFLVNFTDGTRWRTNKHPYNNIPNELTDMILYISEQSGISIQSINE